jgi:hypothetical protein
MRVRTGWTEPDEPAEPETGAIAIKHSFCGNLARNLNKYSNPISFIGKKKGEL